MTSVERVVAVAILLPYQQEDLHDPRQAFAAVPAPARHHHVLHQLSQWGRGKEVDGGQGFITDTGRYVDRKEAWTIAKSAGQLLPIAPTDGRGGTLYSEDVW